MHLVDDENEKVSKRNAIKMSIKKPCLNIYEDFES